MGGIEWGYGADEGNDGGEGDWRSSDQFWGKFDAGGLWMLRDGWRNFGRRLSVDGCEKVVDRGKSDRAGYFRGSN